MNIQETINFTHWLKVVDVCASPCLLLFFLTVIQWASAVSDATTSLRICLPLAGNVLRDHHFWLLPYFLLTSKPQIWRHL